MMNILAAVYAHCKAHFEEHSTSSRDISAAKLTNPRAQKTGLTLKSSTAMRTPSSSLVTNPHAISRTLF
jgi:hypothetical protein